MFRILNNLHLHISESEKDGDFNSFLNAQIIFLKVRKRLKWLCTKLSLFSDRFLHVFPNVILFQIPYDLANRSGAEAYTFRGNNYLQGPYLQNLQWKPDLWSYLDEFEEGHPFPYK